jgi:hypothetical protein
MRLSFQTRYRWVFNRFAVFIVALSRQITPLPAVRESHDS